MARRLRIHLPGGYYHVTLRGNHQQPIFREPTDRALLNAIVARSLAVNVARLHAYCWMTNHLHFLIQIGDTPLGVLMRDIASNYARAFQAKLATKGHLFERRYHAKLIDIDRYLFALLRYIHLNPVTAGLVKNADSYPWSSHRAYAGLTPRDAWIETDFCLAMFSRERGEAHAAYRRFVEEQVNEEANASPDPEREFFGDDEFMSSLAKEVRPSVTSRQSVADLIAEACSAFGIAENDLYSNSRETRLVQVRAWIARQAVLRRAATLSEVARALGRDRATLRYAMKAYAESSG